MIKDCFALIDRLACTHTLAEADYRQLAEQMSAPLTDYAKKKAVAARSAVYADHVYLRGLIEIGNVCRNDCLYCGIRKSNKKCRRYLLTPEQILACCDEGYALGLRSFVLQGGEGVLPTQSICLIVAEIKRRYGDSAVTLSLGEYSREDYQRMYDAGADRYLLRHETADRQHYDFLHPPTMSFDNRLLCLNDLKAIGFQVGCGFMVGSPRQSAATLAKDLKFIEEFAPDMCGIGPFIPHRDTPFAAYPAGDVGKTAYLLSLVRLIKPNVLLPATTALGTLLVDGRDIGLSFGANVIMPNLSPPEARQKYQLYDNKLSSGPESAQNLAALQEHLVSIGYKVVLDRGDVIK